MKPIRREAATPLLAGVALIAVGVLGIGFAHAVGPQPIAANTVQPSLAQLDAVGRRAVRIFPPGVKVLAVYAFRAPNFHNGGGMYSSVLVVMGHGSQAQFYMQEGVGPAGFDSPVLGSNESGWVIFPQATSRGVAAVGPAGFAALSPSLQLRVDDWLHSCRRPAALVTIWPFPSAPLVVAKLGGQDRVVSFPSSGGLPTARLGAPLMCQEAAP